MSRMRDKEMPVGIAVLAFLIFVGVVPAIAIALAGSRYMRGSEGVIFMWALPLATLACGIGLLLRKEWARQLVLVFSLIAGSILGLFGAIILLAAPARVGGAAVVPVSAALFCFGVMFYLTRPEIKMFFGLSAASGTNFSFKRILNSVVNWISNLLQRRLTMNDRNFLQRPPNFSPGDVWRVLTPIAVPVVILFVTAAFFKGAFVYIKPNEYGIKQVNIGFKTGIRDRVYETGLHFVMPLGIEIMHRFPRDIQVFELTNYPQSAAFDSRRQNAAHIQTSDGFFVDVDVSVLYHIEDAYKVITTIGPGRLYEDNGIIPKVEPKLKEALGELTTEEFYNSPLRTEKARRSEELLNQELNPKGIRVDSVLIRYFKYRDEIQRNIEEKKLKDQLVFTNQSKAKASAEEALVTKVRQEGEANIKVKLEEGRAYVVKKNADKDLYVRTRKAEADLLVSLAEARKTELINGAYQKQGSDKLVGLKMAEVYRGLDLIMLSSGGPKGLNPLNLEDSLNMFGIQAEGGVK